MDLTKQLFLLLQFILIFPLIPKTSAQFEFLYKLCGDTTYTPNSPYQSNLQTVLNSLSSDTRTTYGYYNFTAGHAPNKVEAMVLCRADVPLTTCRLCVRASAAALPVVCPGSKAAFGYSDNCVILLSSKPIFHVVRSDPNWGLNDDDDVSQFNIKGSKFNQSLTTLMNTLLYKASLGNSELKFATGKTKLTANETLYGLMQCSPDLSRFDCVACVKDLFLVFPQHFVTPKFIAAGGRVVSPSCNLRYELYPFYGNVTRFATAPAPAPTLPSSLSPLEPPLQVVKKSKSRRSLVIATSIVVGSLALVVIVASICIIFLLRRRKKQKKSSAKFSFSKEEMNTLESLQFSLSTIKAATKDFADSNKLGKGGFGFVYKGELPDGRDIAVKRLTMNSVHGEVQFKNEILILAKLQHRNLVRLLGFCLEEDEMILVYELVINKSLDNFLFDPLHRGSMQWGTRYKIINGIAKGLLYLHEDSRLRIIHRDLKSANVLLDAEFNPKIADFGMARLFSVEQTQAMASKIVGTYGYMAPEYVVHGHVSTKSDVFSFGVLILEIVSGQRVSSFQIGELPENMLVFAWKNWSEGKAWSLVDPTLPAACKDEILRCIHIGLLCVQHNMADRPTMSSVTLMLTNPSLSLKMPSQPANFTRSNTPADVQSQPDGKLDSSCSINEITMTAPYPR